jgi:hypothetical protein
VGNSLQEPAKQTTEVNYPANSVGEYPGGIRQALQKPTAETMDSQKTRRIPNHLTDSPSTRTRRNGFKKIVGRQGGGAPAVTIKRAMLPPFHQPLPLMRGTENHQVQISNVSTHRNE